MFNSQFSSEQIGVESRTGAVICFRSPLIKPDVRISRIRLSDEIHHKTARKSATLKLLESEHAELAIDNVIRKPSRTSRGFPVASSKEMTHPFVDVPIDRPVGSGNCAIGKVTRPTP
jgi:hypothetical protein